MLKAVRHDAVRQYSLKDDKDPKTVFSIGVLDVFLRAWIRDSATSFTRDEKDPDIAKASIGVSRMNVETVRFGLVGWGNFADDQGAPVICDREFRDTPAGKRMALTDGAMNRLHPEWIMELAEQINSYNQLSGDDAKN